MKVSFRTWRSSVLLRWQPQPDISNTRRLWADAFLYDYLLAACSCYWSGQSVQIIKTSTIKSIDNKKNKPTKYHRNKCTWKLSTVNEETVLLISLDGLRDGMDYVVDTICRQGLGPGPSRPAGLCTAALNLWNRRGVVVGISLLIRWLKVQKLK